MAKVNYKICPRCNYITQDTVPGRFCIQCGEKLLKSCRQCRAPIANPFALHCPDCGNAYHLIGATVVAEEVAVGANQDRKFRTVI
jgi:hypothetical protein